MTRHTFLINHLHKATCPKPIINVIGTKSDLVEQRTVTSDEGLHLAQSLNARYYEISSIYSHYDKVAKIFKESADLLKFNLVKVPQY